MKAFGQYAILAAVLASANAQQPVWQQCGGIGWYVPSSIPLILFKTQHCIPTDPLGLAERLARADLCVRY
jgi:hypothetical protein